MKLFFKIIIFIFLLLSIIPALSAGRYYPLSIISVYSQQQIDDYLYQYEQYQKTYQEFTSSRDQYLKYQTLTSQDEAIEATKKIILQRNQVLRAYFLALQWKLRTTSGLVGSSKQEDLISLLDKEITWLEKETEQINRLANPSLNDLFVISDRLEAKSNQLKSLSYQSLSLILIGKMKNLQADSISLTTLLSDQISSIEATKSAELKEWLKEVENKNYLSQKEIELAQQNQELLAKKSKETELPVIYKQIQTNLEKSQEYLNQALTFQKEIYNGL